VPLNERFVRQDNELKIWLPDYDALDVEDAVLVEQQQAEAIAEVEGRKAREVAVDLLDFRWSTIAAKVAQGAPLDATERAMVTLKWKTFREGDAEYRREALLKLEEQNRRRAEEVAQLKQEFSQGVGKALSALTPADPNVSIPAVRF